MIFLVVCHHTRCLLSALMLPTWREASEEAELLVLRHENAVLRRQTGRTRYEPADRLWLAALSRLIPRRRWREELVEGMVDPVVGGDVGGEFVVAAAQILDERVPGGPGAY